MQNPDSYKAGMKIKPNGRTFHLVEKLGEGGMGYVFKAVEMLDENTKNPLINQGKYFALKLFKQGINNSGQSVIPGSETARAIRELHAWKILSRCPHPNFPIVYAINDQIQTPYVATEIFEKSLGNMIGNGEFRNSAGIIAAVQKSIEVANALDYMHEKIGGIHRDIKPENVMIGNDGLAKLIDLGLITWKGAEKLTAAGISPGTYGYIDPAIMYGEKTDDPRADIYAQGVLLYNMLTENFPVVHEFSKQILREGMSQQESLKYMTLAGIERPRNAAQRKEIEEALVKQSKKIGIPISLEEKCENPKYYVPELDNEICRIVMKMINPNRLVRYQNEKELLGDLLMYSGGSRKYDTPKIFVPEHRGRVSPEVIAASQKEEADMKARMIKHAALPKINPRKTSYFGMFLVATALSTALLTAFYPEEMDKFIYDCRGFCKSVYSNIIPSE